jgi:hypothetical protein
LARPAPLKLPTLAFFALAEDSSHSVLPASGCNVANPYGTHFPGNVRLAGDTTGTEHSPPRNPSRIRIGMSHRVGVFNPNR